MTLAYGCVFAFTVAVVVIAVCFDRWFRSEKHGQTKPYDYLSTACLHGRHYHCRKACKFCGVACRCKCHKEKA